MGFPSACSTNRCVLQPCFHYAELSSDVKRDLTKAGWWGHRRGMLDGVHFVSADRSPRPPTGGGKTAGSIAAGHSGKTAQVTVQNLPVGFLTCPRLRQTRRVLTTRLP